MINILRTPWRKHKFLLIVLTMLIGFVGCSKEEPEPAEKRAEESPPAETIELVFTYGSEKKAWINDVTAAFNADTTRVINRKRLTVQAIPMGSGEVIDEVLAGARQPDLVSPASGAFVKLGNAQSRAKTGDDLIGPTDNLVLSPVVIAMWKPMAETLGYGKKPLGWADLMAVTRNPQGWEGYGRPEWGKFKFGHTHPDFSNSGLISVLAMVYAANNKVSNLTMEDANSPATGTFIRNIESAVQHYGSSTGFFGDKLRSGGPGYLSAAVLYESSVIEANQAGQD
ncbi:MAG TPA: substrate-binding domain-containing protein, partial [Tepidisphaeraceae bacterium]